MRSPHLHKVCFQVGGMPVIARSIETYNRCGIENHCVVVGQVLGQVMQAASIASGNIFFCHQTEQLGTGHAARCAAKLLKSIDYRDDVFIVAGDKIIDDSILHRFIDTYYDSGCDMGILVGDATDFPANGKIICDADGNVLGNIEAIDIARMRVLSILGKLAAESEVDPQEAESLVRAYINDESKAARALGPVWASVKAGVAVTDELVKRTLADDDCTVRFDGRAVSLDMLDDIRYSNLSVYMLKAPVFYSAIEKISPRNAQKEEYLTDIIGILAGEQRKIVAVPIDYPEQVMAFNTPEELQAIEDYLAGRKRISVSDAPKTVRLASEWLERFESSDSAAYNYFYQVYGDSGIVESKLRQLAAMLRNYVSRFADEPVIITRAPGRVNIMGRHIDRQGGYANLIALDRDLYLVVGAREDRRVQLFNMRARDIPGRSFDTDDIISDYDGSDWREYVDCAALKDRLHKTPGDWSHYVIAPIARFQAKYPHIQLKGMNIVAAGNVPMAAGLSSSSALVVAVAEAIAHINDMDISPEQFVELCGEGEWYVGTRGGSADHAAMKFAQSGRVVHVSFLPFRMIDNMPFPTDYSFVVCNSQIKAHKTMGAKDIFNHRLACYNIGRELFKLEFPQYAAKIEHLRDINASNLGVEYSELLEMVCKLPDVMTRDEVRERLPESMADEFLRSHEDQPEGYTIRGVVMFGLAECERGRQCAELLRNGKIRDYGRLMNISHDGDRVVKWKRDGTQVPAVADYSDAAMAGMIEQARRGARGANLAMQPGAYRCSTPNIDRMVDIALADRNVLGAQILGAGLGGCILVLISRDKYPELETRMVRDYYEPMGLQPEMFACRPVAGSRVVFF